MAIAHTYNPATRDYVSSADDYGYTPANATTTSLPSRPWTRQWPRWVGTGWELVADHRERKAPAFRAEDVQEATEFWLPGDTHDTPARQLFAPGPLPEGAMTERPEKPAPTDAELFARLRAARDARLAATDYLVMPDYPLDEETRTEVEAYRQALRDLPAREGAPWDGGGELTPWPEMPASV